MSVGLRAFAISLGVDLDFAEPHISRTIEECYRDSTEAVARSRLTQRPVLSSNNNSSSNNSLPLRSTPLASYSNVPAPSHQPQKQNDLFKRSPAHHINGVDYESEPAPRIPEPHSPPATNKSTEQTKTASQKSMNNNNNNNQAFAPPTPNTSSVVYNDDDDYDDRSLMDPPRTSSTTTTSQRQQQQIPRKIKKIIVVRSPNNNNNSNIKESKRVSPGRPPRNEAPRTSTSPARTVISSSSYNRNPTRNHNSIDDTEEEDEVVVAHHHNNNNHNNNNNNNNKRSSNNNTPSYFGYNEDVLGYARFIGIDPDAESWLLPLAKEGLYCSLPAGWKKAKSRQDAAIYYYNEKTQETSWEHPMDEIYRNRVADARNNRKNNVLFPRNDENNNDARGRSTTSVASSTSNRFSGNQNQNNNNNFEQQQHPIFIGNKNYPQRAPPVHNRQNQSWNAAHLSRSQESASSDDATEYYGVNENEKYFSAPQPQQQQQDKSNQNNNNNNNNNISRERSSSLGGHKGIDDRVEAFAEYLRIDPVHEQYLFPIAREALLADLPPNFRSFSDKEGTVYYFNTKTEETSWDHPNIEKYYKQIDKARQKHVDEAAKKKNAEGSNPAAKKSVGLFSCFGGGGNTTTSDDDENNRRYNNSRSNQQKSSSYTTRPAATSSKSPSRGRAGGMPSPPPPRQEKNTSGNNNNFFSTNNSLMPNGSQSHQQHRDYDSNNNQYPPEILQYAKFLGVNPKNEPELMPIVEEGFNAPLPEGWESYRSSDDDGSTVYYANTFLGKSLWDHPLDDDYRQRIKDARAKNKRRSYYS